MIYRWHILSPQWLRTGDSKCRIPFQCVDTALYAPIWYSKLFPSAPVGSSHHWRSCPTGLGSLLLQFSSIMLCPVSHSHQEQNFFKNGGNKIKEPYLGRIWWKLQSHNFILKMYFLVCAHEVVSITDQFWIKCFFGKNVNFWPKNQFFGK